MNWISVKDKPLAVKEKQIIDKDGSKSDWYRYAKGYDERRLFAIKTSKGVFDYQLGHIEDETGAIIDEYGDDLGWSLWDVDYYMEIEKPNELSGNIG